MRLCRLQSTSAMGHMLHVFWHSISRGSSYESKLHKHMAEPPSMLLTFLPVWPAGNVNHTVGFGMQKCNWNRTMKLIHYEQPLSFRTDWPILNSNNSQKWEASSSAMEESNTIYIHTHILERKITSKTKFVTGLSLYWDMRKKDSLDLWKLLLADKSVEPSFQRIWASYSHPHQYSGDRQKILEARAKIKAF